MLQQNAYEQFCATKWSQTRRCLTATSRMGLGQIRKRFQV